MYLGKLLSAFGVLGFQPLRFEVSRFAFKVSGLRF
jgi:hypothetical protein